MKTIKDSAKPTWAHFLRISHTSGRTSTDSPPPTAFHRTPYVPGAPRRVLDRRYGVRAVCSAQRVRSLQPLPAHRLSSCARSVAGTTSGRGGCPLEWRGATFDGLALVHQDRVVCSVCVVTKRHKILSRSRVICVRVNVPCLPERFNEAWTVTGVDRD